MDRMLDGSSRPGALELKAASELFHEPRVLQDTRLLGALHAELLEELGAEQAASALLQVGWFQGLRDATRLLQRGFFELGPEPGALPTSPLLTMRLAPLASDLPRGAIEVRGIWPEHIEASAHASALGVSRDATCYASAGYTSGWLSGVLEVELLALEESCSTCGDEACTFVAREPEVWRRRGDARALRLLASLDVARLRELVAEELESEAPAAQGESGFDPNSPVVHVWGPVMILPFSGPEASIQAVELIGNDPGAAGVKVVVVDLGGVILDEGYGAVALERVIDAVHGFGAEPILTGVSPLCEPLIASLECGQVLVEKDLSQAIATAFQIAHAQCRGV
ncbi:MAG: 4-vinyl reductase [Deltaproteobacteria bacterium]|nr:MAG: 4-vinyl reductase [Deltaproteobacteria bacterium]